jgi:hypothetical protein
MAAVLTLPAVLSNKKSIPEDASKGLVYIFRLVVERLDAQFLQQRHLSIRAAAPKHRHALHAHQLARSQPHTRRRRRHQGDVARLGLHELLERESSRPSARPGQA